MTAFVTGGCGLVGSHVTKQLAAAGHPVVVYDMNPDRRHLDSVLTEDERALVTVARGDLLDMPLIVQLTLEHDIDRFVHLAYLGRKSMIANPAWSQYVNVVGTNNIFEIAATVGAPLSWASTIDVFGPKSVGADGLVANDAPYDPNNIYGSCKAHNEVTARDYADLKGLRSLAVRLPPVFGPAYFPMQTWVYFLPKLIDSIIRAGAGQYPAFDEELPWGFVDDIAAAMVAALEPRQRTGFALTLDGPVVTMAQIVQAVRDRFPSASMEPVEYPHLGVPTNFDTSWAKTEIGWDPQVGVVEGVERIARYYETLS